MLYDSDFLYIGVRAFDDPDNIIAREMRHDSKFDSDDHISFILDSFGNGRNAYRMRVNPLGAKSDGLVEASRDIGDEWDGIWYAKTSVNSDGWVAEIAIPFKTVSFSRDRTSWGFNFERVIRRNNEVIRWTALRGGRGINDIDQAGSLDNLIGIEKGIGLDLKPTATLRYLGGESDSTSAIPSLDILYRPTPSITALATFKTDFAEAEGDERELNLGRFDLFYPEKRDFFLQDAGIFNFGGLKRNGRPFHSRRIGLDARGEEEIPVLAGAKITGRTGPVSFGILDVQTEETGDIDQANLAVARATLDILDQSRLGFILTNGNPTSDATNTVIGADLLFRTDRFFGDNTAIATAWAIHSFNGDTDSDSEEEKKGGGPSAAENQERGWAYGGRFEFPNEPVDFAIGFAEIQEGYHPALGFVNRAGIRQYEAEGHYRFRLEDHAIRTIDIGGGVEVFTDDLNNKLQTVDAKVDAMKITNAFGDMAKLTYRYGYELLEEDEKIAGKIPVSAGEYRSHGIGVTLESSQARQLSGGLEISYGGFYDGTLLKFKPYLVWRPNPHVRLGVEYEENWIRTDGADLNARLVGVRAGYYFSPDMNISGVLQYDNLSREVSVAARFRWTIKPGNEFFVIFDRSYESDEDDIWDLKTLETRVATKLGWTFRF